MNQSDTPDFIVVATHRKWISEYLAEPGVLPVVWDPGFDAPDLPHGMKVAWWMPTEHAVRLLHSGIILNLAATGPQWLSSVPKEFLGREIWSGQVKDLDDAPRFGWCKPAEVKIDTLPAAWYDSMDDFLAAVQASGAPDTMWIQVCPKRIEFHTEYRYFIANGRLVASSPYLRTGHTWSPEMETELDPYRIEANLFARDVVEAMGSNQPAGYVLDVGLTVEGDWIVIESNPAWSANPYSAAPSGIIQSLAAASMGIVGDVSSWGKHGIFQWKPDDWLHQYAHQRQPLRLSTPAWSIPVS